MSTRRITVDQFQYEESSLGKNAIGSQHYHDFFEIYFLEEGSCHYFIDDDAYDVRAGDVVLIPEGTIHKTMYDDTEHRRRLIYCNASYIPPTVSHRLASMHFIYRNDKVTERIRSLFDLIAREYTAPDEFSKDVILHYVHLLFFLLVRHTDGSMPHRSGNAYTTQTIAYIKQNYAEEIRLSDLARRCSISPEHLSRLFKQETGFGVSEYLSMIRLQQAQRLLKESPALSIATVAGLCGYNDSNYFSEQFKRMHGVSPLRYRNEDT